MKKIQHLFTILICFPLCTTIISLYFLPPQVVAHYGRMGKDQYESKYFLLLIPFLCLFWGAVLNIIMKEAINSSKEKDRKHTVIGCIITILIMNVVHIILLVSSFLSANNIHPFSSFSLSKNHTMAFVYIFIALLIGGIGLSCFFKKKPVGIYSNVEAPPLSRIKDLKKYNRAVGKLFVAYSLPYFYCGFLALSDFMTATAVMILSAMPGGIILMVIYECVIDKKYVRH